MAVLTLTGHLGSMGEIARICARELGYDLMDRELALQAAQALGLSDEEVTALDERTGGFGGRLARLMRDFLERAGYAGGDAMAGGVAESLMMRSYREAAAPEMRPDDERYIEALRGLINDLAERGNIVLVGRGAQAILAGRPGVVHARVACEQDERVRRIMRRDGMTEEAARERVRDSDAQREAWHRKYFDVDYREPYLYHLVVNAGWLSDPQAAEVVCHAVRVLEREG